MKMHCWKCNKDMGRIKDTFHNFDVNAWKCSKCKEIIYDEDKIQPILQYNKLKEEKLAVKVGLLGNSKMFRFPKIVEPIYDIHQGERLKIDLEPNRIIIETK
jgi:hypothetical protein